MIKLYKLTDNYGKTRNGTQWGPGISHSGTGEGGLCGPGWIHAYEHPLIAVLMNPIHANFQNPRLWEAEGEVGLRDGQFKCGCKTLTTIREIPLPSITTEMRVRFAIMCAREAATADAAWKEWEAWADRWLSGGDRSGASADAAASAAWSASAASAAYRASWEAAASAAWSASAASAAYRSASAARARAAEAWAAEAAEAAREVGHGIDIFEIAEKACSGLRDEHKQNMNATDTRFPWFLATCMIIALALVGYLIYLAAFAFPAFGAVSQKVGWFLLVCGVIAAVAATWKGIAK